VGAVMSASAWTLGTYCSLPARGVPLPRDTNDSLEWAKTTGANDSIPVRMENPTVDHNRLLFMMQASHNDA
jgi:hypothetical protein